MILYMIFAFFVVIFISYKLTCLENSMDMTDFKKEVKEEPETNKDK